MSVEKNREITKAEVVNENLEKIFDKGKEFLHNVASHLPFANLAKKRSGDFHIEVDLPGVKKEDIDINIADHILTVTAERKMKKEVKESDYYILESSFGKIVRSFSIPDGIDMDKIDAEFKDGRLFITLEKQEALKPKAIKVK
jgi:HSP20 family protein